MITETPTLIIELNQYKNRLHTALKAAKICVFEVDLTKRLYTFFDNAEDIFGVSGEQILKDVQPFSLLSNQEYEKQIFHYFSHPEDSAVIQEAFNKIEKGVSTTYEARMRASGSEFKWCKIDVTPVLENDVPVRMIGVITDIGTLREKTEFLKHEAQLDGFTGLYNKKHLTKKIRHYLLQHTFQEHAFVLIDIDNFKQYNDTFGHAEGDKVLQLVAKCIKKCFRNSDIIGRFGGDEFIVFIPNAPSAQWLESKVNQILVCSQDHYTCSLSIGASLFPQDGKDFETLFDKADKALYHSKITKQTYTIYHSDIDA